MTGIKSRLLSGALWTVAGRGVTSVIAAISTIVLARLLTPGDFGIVAIATATLAIAMAVTELSLTSALVVQDEVEIDHVRSVWTLSLLRSVGVFLIFFAGAEPLAKFYGDLRLVPVLVATGVTGAISGMNSPLLALKSKQLSFKPAFYVETTQRIVTFVVSIALALELKTYWALVVGPMIGVTAAAILSYIISPFAPRLRFLALGHLFRFSIWLSLSRGITMLAWRSDQLIVGYFLPKTQLGLYTVADNVAAIPIRESIQPLAQTLFPGFAKIKDDPSKVRRGFALAQSTISLIAFPVAAGFALVAEPFVKLTMGDKWLGAVPVLQILCVVQAVAALTVPLQGLALAHSETRMLFRRDLIAFLIRLPITVAGLLAYGLIGLGVARLATAIIGAGLNFRLINRMIGLSALTQLKNQLRTLAAVATMALGLFACHRLMITAGFGAFPTLTFLVIVGICLYALSVALFWRLAGLPDGPEREMQVLIKSFIARRKR